MASGPRFSGVLFGAAYYPEYQPDLDLERDMTLMREAGFTVIRVGESVWSTWEPREGHFELDWLEPTLDAAHRRGISVILGTPTYAIPPWMQRRHPEIAAELSTGVRMPWGARQEMDQSSPAYRFYAERIVRKVVGRYAAHPSVVGFQVDNEPGMRLPHNEQTFQRFVDWLRQRYDSVEQLNDRWGLVYWSHRLSDWADLWRPDGNTTPQYDIEWRRFQGSLATELITWQAELVRDLAGPHQFVTTCLSYTRSQVVDDAIVAPLDITAGNPYYRMQDGLNASCEIPTEDLWWSTGVWALFQWGDRAYSSAASQFLVTETNAQAIGEPWDNFIPYPGQVRQAAFALLARGARMIQYWHWHTLHFGAETTWGGVLPHSQKPGRIFREVAELGRTLQSIGSALDDYVPHADVTMLYSTESKWALEFQSPLRLPEGGPDRSAYAHIFDSFYRGLFEAGAQVRIQHVSQFLAVPASELVDAHPVLVAPALFVASDEVLEHLKAYAEAGGHLVLGIRSGYGDELARARMAEPPAVLTGPAGVSYGESSTLVGELGVVSGGSLEIEPGSAGKDWLDVLDVADAEVLAKFDSNDLGAETALTTRAHGAGRISYVGTVPNTALARSLARWLVPQTAAQAWSAPSCVSISTGSAGESELVFIANWSGQRCHVTAPGELSDLEAGSTFQSGDRIELQPRAALLLTRTSTTTRSASPR